MSDASLNQTPRAQPAGPSRVPLRVALYSIVGFWVLYFVVNSLRATIERGGWQFGMMERRTLVSLTGMVLTFLFSLILRRLEGRSMAALVTAAFLVAMPVSVGYAAVNTLVFYVHDQADTMMETSHSENPAGYGYGWVIADAAVNWYFFVVAWGILYVALSYAGKVGRAERTAALYRAEAHTAQLRALRYQINPHFLFNTLNSLSSLILRQRTDEAERMIMNLANFFRTSLTSDPTEDVPLADEVRLQRLYLEIELTRFPDRLRVEIDVPHELDSAPVPGLILQPLVENAIKHGVARSARPVTLAIRAWAEGGRLHITVEDDGEPSAEAAGGHGLGLRNVCERLATRFDGDATCHYGAREGGGFQVDLTMPLGRRLMP
jgi:two-component sensor histidine kinase